MENDLIKSGEKMNIESKRRKGLQLYYFDIETTGVDSEKDKVITWQFASLDFWNPQMVVPITIFPSSITFVIDK